MSRLWRQELAAFRRARRDVCVSCAAPVPLAIAVEVFTYALEPSRARPGRVAAQLCTECRGKLAFCPRHLRALKRGDALRTGNLAVTLAHQRATTSTTAP